MFSGAPDGSKILCNTLATTGTLVTVPAGHWYTADVVISASVSVAGASNPTVTVNGAGAFPAPGTVVARLNITGLSLATTSDTIHTEILVKAPAENDITIDFTAGAAGTSSASINGFAFG